MIFTCVFYHTTGPHVQIQFLFTLPIFYIIFILSPTPFLPCFSSTFSSILITEFEIELELSLYGIFSPCSCHVARLVPNIYSFTVVQHSFSLLLCVYKPSFHHVLPSNIKLRNGFEFSHSSSAPATMAFSFVHYSLVDLLCVMELYFCSFVATSINPIYLPKCIQQFLQDRHTWRVPRVFYESLSLKRRSPTFHYRTRFFCCLPIFSYQTPRSKFTFFPPGKRSQTTGFEL